MLASPLFFSLKNTRKSQTIDEILQVIMKQENKWLEIQDAHPADSVREMLIIIFISLSLCALSILSVLSLGFNLDFRQLIETNSKLQLFLKKAQEANKTKSFFLANMSHEIWIPMNGEYSMAELLESTPWSIEQQAINSSVRLMIRLINDLLLFSKIQAGTLDNKRQRLDLEQFMMRINEASAVKAAKKGIQYVFQLNPLVPHLIVADSGRLCQVLLNLIDNSPIKDEFS